MQFVTVHEAKTHLSEIIARVERGDPRLLIVSLPLPPLPPCAIGCRRIRVIGARSLSRARRNGPLPLLAPPL